MPRRPSQLDAYLGETTMLELFVFAAVFSGIMAAYFAGKKAGQS